METCPGTDFADFRGSTLTFYFGDRETFNSQTKSPPPPTSLLHHAPYLSLSLPLPSPTLNLSLTLLKRPLQPSSPIHRATSRSLNTPPLSRPGLFSCLSLQAAIERDISVLDGGLGGVWVMGLELRAEEVRGWEILGLGGGRKIGHDGRQRACRCVMCRSGCVNYIVKGAVAA